MVSVPSYLEMIVKELVYEKADLLPIPSIPVKEFDSLLVEAP